MKDPRIFRLCAATAVAVIAFANHTSAQNASIKTRIVGNWTTVSAVNERDDGSKVNLFGDKPNGLTIFTEDGFFSQVVQRSDLPKIASGNRQTASPEENKAIVQGNYALFGVYTVNEADQTFTVRILGSSFPNEIGTQSTRKVTIDANQLTFINSVAASGGRGAVVTLRKATP